MLYYSSDNLFPEPCHHAWKAEAILHALELCSELRESTGFTSGPQLVDIVGTSWAFLAIGKDPAKGGTGLNSWRQEHQGQPRKTLAPQARAVKRGRPQSQGPTAPRRGGCTMAGRPAEFKTSGTAASHPISYLRSPLRSPRPSTPSGPQSSRRYGSRTTRIICAPLGSQKERSHGREPRVGK